MRSTKCPRCGESKKPQHSYCQDCRSAYMRDWRKDHPLTKDQKLKGNARSYAGVYVNRGLIQRQPCMVCGSQESEMHHEDYTKPTDVIWLCRVCHLTWHAEGGFAKWRSPGFPMRLRLDQ